MPDRMESFLEDRSYYFTLRDDAELLRRVAGIRGDAEVAERLSMFLLRLRAIAALTLAYWRHGQSGNRTDIAWEMGFAEDDDPLGTLDAFLAEFGLTDHDLHHKSLLELAHKDPETGALAGCIESSRENYLVFLRSLPISFRSSHSTP